MPTALELLQSILDCQRESLAELRKLTARKETARAARRATESGTFGKFWEVYPRRDAKIAAVSAYENAIKVTGATAEKISEGARLYAVYCRENRLTKKLTALPASWLNAGRWEDESMRSEKPRPPEVRDPSEPNPKVETPEEEARRVVGEWTDRAIASMPETEIESMKAEIKRQLPLVGDGILRSHFRNAVRAKYGCPFKF